MTTLDHVVTPEAWDAIATSYDELVTATWTAATWSPCGDAAVACAPPAYVVSTAS
jgi:hypothetical protein